MNKILLEALPKTIDLSFIEIPLYGLFIMIGIFVASYLAIREAKRLEFDENHIIDGLLMCVPLAIIGARLYYVIFEFDQFGFDILKIIGLKDGGLQGLAIHGGIITTGIFVYFYTKKRKINIWHLLDLVAPSFLVAQAFGRWGNFINQEAHGPETTRDFLKGTLKLPNFIVNQMEIYGVYYHPTFLYESMWNLIGFALIIIFRRKNFIKSGDFIFLYAIWYGFGRMFIELLRTDSLYIFGIKTNVLISIIFFVGGIIGLIVKRRLTNNEKYVDNLTNRRYL